MIFTSYSRMDSRPAKDVAKIGIRIWQLMIWWQLVTTWTPCPYRTERWETNCHKSLKCAADKTGYSTAFIAHQAHKSQWDLTHRFCCAAMLISMIRLAVSYINQSQFCW